MKNHRNFLFFLLMLILVPLAGEPKFHPFTNELATFRVSFGSPVFLLFLLWLRNTPFVLSGFCVGISVTLFRVFLDLWSGDITFTKSLWLHGPTFFYYFTYAACFHLPKFDTALYSKALQIAGWSILAEILASLAELTITALTSSGAIDLSFDILFKISLIAVLRCLFILSFFFIAQIYQAETRTRQEQEEKQHLMLLIAGLYKEIIQLSNSQKNAEAVTRDCYKIYETLQDENAVIDRQTLASDMLRLAGQVHEIKKDNQRIHAGLQQLTAERKINDYMAPAELSQFIVDSNQKYARSLGKLIRFYLLNDATLPPLHAYRVLSLVNNLAANAVEASDDVGVIHLAFTKVNDHLQIEIWNTGKAIPMNKIPLFFKPGYTTKFAADGKPSNGVGLTYVKYLAESLGGTIQVVSDESSKIIFTLSIPLANLKG